MFSGLISATLVQIGGRTATTIPRLKDIAIAIAIFDHLATVPYTVVQTGPLGKSTAIFAIKQWFTFPQLSLSLSPLISYSYGTCNRKSTKKLYCRM